MNFKVIDFNSVKDYTPRDSRVYYEGFTSNAPFIRWFENCDRWMYKISNLQWLFRCYPIKFHTSNPFMKSFQQLFLRIVAASSLKPDPSLRFYVLQLKHSFIRLILDISINILWPHCGYHACDRSVFTFVTTYAHIQWVSVVHVVLLHVFTFLVVMSA